MFYYDLYASFRSSEQKTKKNLTSSATVFDLLENSTVHLIEFIPERVYEARCIRRTLVYSTNTNMCFTAMPKLDYGLIDTPVEKETITRKTFATEKLTFFSDFKV